jgi:predicted nucleic-acid-binding protein
MSALEEGTVVADIAETVVFECIYVTTTQYRMSREYLVDSLSSIISLQSVRLSSKSSLLGALALWGKYRRLSFADALHLVLASQSEHKRIATFDMGMDTVLPGVTRIEQLP